MAILIDGEIRIRSQVKDIKSKVTKEPQIINHLLRNNLGWNAHREESFPVHGNGIIKFKH